MLSRISACLLGIGIPVLAQLDSFTLRQKFGPPLSRETFHMPQGFDMVIDYGPSGQVCRVEVPSMMPSKESVSNDTVQHDRMNAFLAEVVPASMRGEKGQAASMRSGTISILSTEYDNVIVVESSVFGRHDNHMAIAFKRPECQKTE